MQALAAYRERPSTWRTPKLLSCFSALKVTFAKISRGELYDPQCLDTVALAQATISM